MSKSEITTYKCDLCGKVCDPLRSLVHVENWGFFSENPLRIEFTINLGHGYADACQECILKRLKKMIQEIESEGAE